MADDAPISTAANFVTADSLPIVPQEIGLPQAPTSDDLDSWNGGCLYVPYNPSSFAANVAEYGSVIQVGGPDDQAGRRKLAHNRDSPLIQTSGLEHLASMSAEGPAQNLLDLTLHGHDPDASSKNSTSIMTDKNGKDGITTSSSKPPQLQVEEDQVMSDAWKEDEMDICDDLIPTASGKPDM